MISKMNVLNFDADGTVDGNIVAPETDHDPMFDLLRTAVVMSLAEVQTLGDGKKVFGDWHLNLETKIVDIGGGRLRFDGYVASIGKPNRSASARGVYYSWRRYIVSVEEIRRTKEAFGRKQLNGDLV